MQHWIRFAYDYPLFWIQFYAFFAKVIDNMAPAVGIEPVTPHMCWILTQCTLGCLRLRNLHFKWIGLVHVNGMSTAIFGSGRRFLEKSPCHRNYKPHYTKPNTLFINLRNLKKGLSSFLDSNGISKQSTRFANQSCYSKSCLKC